VDEDVIALADFHHSQLFQSLIYLVEKRLGGKLYRPGGREWYDRGFYHHPLEAEAIANLTSGSSNEFCEPAPNEHSWQKPSETSYFDQDNLKFRWLPLERIYEVDYLICTTDRNEQRFLDMKRNLGLKAKTWRYVGNREESVSDNFDLGLFATKRYYDQFKSSKPCVLYRPEFDLELYRYSPLPTDQQFLRTFLNFIHHHRERNSPLEIWNRWAGWANEVGCLTLMHGLGTPPPDVKVEMDVIIDTCFDKMGRPELKDRSKWPDLRFNQGEPSSHKQIAMLMGLSNIVQHVKRGSEGYGFVLHCLAAMGRPPIVEQDAYRELSAYSFLDHKETCLFINGNDSEDQANLRWALEPENNQRLSETLHRRFLENVNFEAEAEQIRKLL